MAKTSSNPLFTRNEKRRLRKKVSHAVRGGARKGLARLLGISLSPGLGASSSRRSAHRSSSAYSRKSGTATSAPATSTVRADVISALKNQGYSKGQAERMVPREQSGEGFDSLFRRAVQKNPGELIIFGNPAKVYGRKQIVAAKKAGNPIPAALLTGFESALGSIGASVVTTKRTKKRSSGHPARRKRGNPDALDKADALFETFHGRGSSGVYDTQRSAKHRKDFTILGPLVAIGINAEIYDQRREALGKRAWEGYKVDHWDKLPHLAFLTGPQVEHVKRILSEPDKYVKDCPQLASSPNGEQLYAITPDGVEIDLRQFDTDATKDFVDLGEATFVVYVAKKPDEAVEWIHELGEESGVRPRLALNRLGKKELFFVGGSYYIGEHKDGSGRRGVIN